MKLVPDLLIGNAKDMWLRELIVESDILNTHLCLCLKLLHLYICKDKEYYIKQYFTESDKYHC